MRRHTDARILAWSWLASWVTGGPLLQLRTQDGQALRCERQREEWIAQQASMAAEERDGR